MHERCRSAGRVRPQPDGRHRRVNLVHPATASGVLVLSLSLAGCAGSSTPDDSEARQVVELFVTRLRTGDVDAAWESTTADFKSDEGRDTFRKFVKDRTVLGKPLEFTELKQVEVHGLTRWAAILHPQADAKGKSATVRVTIAQEGGVWKVERIQVE